MKKIIANILAVLFIVLSGTIANAQVVTTVTVTGTPTPAAQFAGSPYATLADAIAALNGMTALSAGGTVTLTCAAGAKTAGKLIT